MHDRSPEAGGRIAGYGRPTPLSIRRRSVRRLAERSPDERRPNEGVTMRYLLLIYNAEPTEPVPDEAMAGELAGYQAFTDWTRERGHFLGGEALHPTSAATTVRVIDGRTVTTDGPFAETKEALGGYYLIEAKDLDEAIDCAARIPGATHGSVEIRPILDLM
jgi:hypothetical protein